MLKSPSAKELGRHKMQPMVSGIGSGAAKEETKRQMGGTTKQAPQKSNLGVNRARNIVNRNVANATVRPSTSGIASN